MNWGQDDSSLRYSHIEFQTTSLPQQTDTLAYAVTDTVTMQELLNIDLSQKHHNFNKEYEVSSI